MGGNVSKAYKGKDKSITGGSTPSKRGNRSAIGNLRGEVEALEESVEALEAAVEELEETVEELKDG